MTIIAFSGHRPDKLGGYRLPNPTYIHICQEIEKTLTELRPYMVITGMALGVDQWAANVARKMKIPYIAAIPFEGQECKWPKRSQRTYRALRKLAMGETIVCPGDYSAEKMQLRNQWMVDNADALIAIWDGSRGGTKNCIEYAKSQNKQIYYIDPRLDK